MEQFNSTRLNSIYGIILFQYKIGRTIDGLACLAAGGGPKRRYQYCSDSLGSIMYLRALQGHSGDSIIDLAMQDHVLIAPGIFPSIHHVEAISISLQFSATD